MHLNGNRLKIPDTVSSGMIFGTTSHQTIYRKCIDSTVNTGGDVIGKVVGADGNANKPEGGNSHVLF